MGKWRDNHSDTLFEKAHNTFIIEQVQKELGLAFMLAGELQDKEEATDMVTSHEGVVVRMACRIRRKETKDRDLTIRAKRASGKKTELEKLLAGGIDYYFYGWDKEDGVVGDWQLVDMNILLASGLLEEKPLFWNGNNAYLIALHPFELRYIHLYEPVEKYVTSIIADSGFTALNEACKARREKKSI